MVSLLTVHLLDGQSGIVYQNLCNVDIAKGWRTPIACVNHPESKLLDRGRCFACDIKGWLSGGVEPIDEAFQRPTLYSQGNDLQDRDQFQFSIPPCKTLEDKQPFSRQLRIKHISTHSKYFGVLKVLNS